MLSTHLEIDDTAMSTQQLNMWGLRHDTSDKLSSHKMKKKECLDFMPASFFFVTLVKYISKFKIKQPNYRLKLSFNIITGI